MVLVSAVGRSDQRPGVDDQHSWSRPNPSARIGLAQVYGDTAWVCDLQWRYRDALEFGIRALEQFRSLDGHELSVARALSRVGWYHMLCDEAQRAIEVRPRFSSILADAYEAKGA